MALSSEHRILLLVVVACALGLFVALAEGERFGTAATAGRESPRSTGSSATLHHSGSGGGLAPVPSNDAQPPLAWGEPRPEHEPLLAGAQQITPHEADDDRFLELGPLLLWVIPFGLPGDDGRLAAECAAKYEPQLRRSCQWRTDYVIRRIDGREVARLEHLRVTPVRDNDDPACRALASCTASVWARQVDVPMPRAFGDVLAFHEFGRGARWTPSKGDREQFYRQALEEAEVRLEHMHAEGDLDELLEDPIERYNYEWTQRSIAEYENALAIIREQEGTEPP